MATGVGETPITQSFNSTIPDAFTDNFLRDNQCRPMEFKVLCDISGDEDQGTKLTPTHARDWRITGFTAAKSGPSIQDFDWDSL